jgi:hypothetical protein
MDACVEKVSARLGSPIYRDEQLVVYALASAKKPDVAKKR